MLNTRRIVKDFEILNNNVQELKSKGIYFNINDTNISKIHILITPREKKENNIESPYTGGFFIFEITFPNEYPMEPPAIQFNPKQNMCRLHPNYYQCGKVCLSIINTWGKEDWSPSMSLMALIITLEERFYEKSLMCEPGFENANLNDIIKFNTAVEYSKYKLLVDILNNKYIIFNNFNTIIIDEFNTNYKWHKERLDKLKGTVCDIILPCYGNLIHINYNKVIQDIELFLIQRNIYNFKI